MFSSAEKTKNVNVQRQQQTPQQTFFRKAGEESFFGPTENPSFFSSAIQAKLSVSSPDDPQEKEADAVADQVMRMPEPAMTNEKKEEEKLQRKEDDKEEVQAKLQAPVISVQRKCESCEHEEKAQAKLFRMIQRSEETSSSAVDFANTDSNSEYNIDRKELSIHHSDVIQRSGRGPPTSSIQGSFEQNLSSSKGAGSALPSSTQQFMNSRFNADFSGVRIHTGSYAENLSSNIHAQAFTYGNDIYFNSGKYSPHTEAGGTLLAHELTHTIQQGATPSHTQTTVATKSVARKNVEPSIVLKSSGNKQINRNIISNAVLSQIDLSAKSGGHQLEESAREYLQSHFNINLSDIRIHNGFDVVEACKAAGVNAFVQGKNIGIIPSKFNPETESGALLLSEQVSISLKQRGIKTTKVDGNDSGGFSSLLKQIKEAVLENKNEEVEAIKQAKINVEKKMPALELPSGKGKKKAGSGTASSKKTKKGKSKKNAMKDDGIVIKPVKKHPKKSPKIPAEDPAFLKVISKTKKTAKNQKEHEPSDKKSIDAQNNAEAVKGEAEGKAQNRKTDGMGEAAKKDQPFDAESFKKDLLQKIESITPKTLKEANEFKENNKIDNVKSAMNEKVAEEKESSTGPVAEATTLPLSVNPADNKQSVPLPPTVKGIKPGGLGSKDAAPKKKMDEEVSMEEQSQSLDAEMKSNNVTESQLKNSNEPDFQKALDEKKSAQKDAEEKPKEFRKDEKLVLKEAQTATGEQTAKTMTQMFNSRGKNFDATVSQQKTTKQKDEEKRTEVTTKINDLYAAAEKKVTDELASADKESNEQFDTGAAQARKLFEDYVSNKMYEYKRKRYSGFWGGLRWAKDKLFGMPSAVNVFYKDGRELYIKKMDEVITNVANTVTLHLNNAKNAITEGKKQIDDYVKTLPEDLKKVGKEATESIQDKFDSLEQTVNDKRNDLIDGLAKKYVDNVKQLDERIEELKEANKGLIDKAIGFLKKVWQVIKDLVNLFKTILSKLAEIIGIILNSPGDFFDNLGKAFDKGFNNFKEKFTEYLEKGLMEWLGTNLGIKGFVIPDKFDASAFFSIALQVMGITKEKIRERAVKVLGERKVKLIEQAGGLLYRIYNEGVGVIWEMIQQKLSDFKDMVWEAIKSFIQQKIITEAIKFILSMLNPIGAFIKVCMAIYNFLMTLVRFKDRIIELLDTLLNAVISIASGAIDSAALAIEKALAKSISIIIAFLAAVLGLNNIAGKVREIIVRVQSRVEKAIDWALGKANLIAGKVLDSALNVVDKGKAMVEKGKEKVVGMGKAAVGKVLSWLGIRKEFTMENGDKHTLALAKSGSRGQLMIESTPMPLLTFINQFAAQPGLSADKIQAANEARTFATTEVMPILNQVNAAPEGTDTKILENQLLNKMVELTNKVRLLVGKEELLSNHVDKYLLEGAAGTFASMPKPVRDDMTADHIPQNALFQVVMGLGLFNAGSPMDKHAEKRTDDGYAMNEQDARHKAGRTWGPKGSVTKANFKDRANAIMANSSKPTEKKNAIVEEIKKDKNEDITKMKSIYSKNINDPVWKDVKDLPLKEEDKISLQSTIKNQAASGLTLLNSQNLDALKV